MTKIEIESNHLKRNSVSSSVIRCPCKSFFFASVFILILILCPCGISGRCLYSLLSTCCLLAYRPDRSPLCPPLSRHSPRISFEPCKYFMWCRSKIGHLLLDFMYSPSRPLHTDIGSQPASYCGGRLFMWCIVVKQNKFILLNKEQRRRRKETRIAYKDLNMYR